MTNLDPRECDCGKYDYCPLWTDEWKAYAPEIFAEEQRRGKEVFG